MKKRGQILSQPFIFIFALVVGSLILVWGSSVIVKLIHNKEYIQLSTTINDIKDDVTTYYNYRPGNKFSFKGRDAYIIPNNIKYVCFTNPSIKEYDIEESELLLIDESLPAILKTSNKNMHIFPRKYKISSFTIPHLISTENPLCIHTVAKLEGKLEFTLETKANQTSTYVELSR